MLGQARYLCVIGRARLVPSWLAKVHPSTGTPLNATVFLGKQIRFYIYVLTKMKEDGHLKCLSLFSRRIVDISTCTLISYSYCVLTHLRMHLIISDTEKAQDFAIKWGCNSG